MIHKFNFFYQLPVAAERRVSAPVPRSPLRGRGFFASPYCMKLALSTMISVMVGGAVIVGVLLVWLASRRAQFIWRISWITGIFVVISATSLVAGNRLASGIAGGIFELVGGIVNLIKNV